MLKHAAYDKWEEFEWQKVDCGHERFHTAWVAHICTFYKTYNNVYNIIICFIFIINISSRPLKKYLRRGNFSNTLILALCLQQGDNLVDPQNSPLIFWLLLKVSPEDKEEGQTCHTAVDGMHATGRRCLDNVEVSGTCSSFIPLGQSESRCGP